MLNTFELKDLLYKLFEKYDKCNIKYCLLRNYESLPERVDSSDIDILLSRRHRYLNRKIISELARKYGLSTYNHHKDERFDGVFFYKRLSKDNLFFLKLDFFFDCEIYGISLIGGDSILGRRVKYKNFYVANDEDRFFHKWLFGYVLNAPLPTKYNADFKRIIAANFSDVRSSLIRVMGRKQGERLGQRLEDIDDLNRLPKVSKVELLRILFRNALKSPFLQCWHFCLFLVYRCKERLLPYGEFISFSGPDGSGKTTVLDMAREKLAMAFRMGEQNTFHFRPSVLPRIAELAKNAKLVDNVDSNYSEPHRANPSGPLGSFMRLAYYALDYLVGYMKVIRPILVKRELVISDRYFYDLIADPGRSRIALPLGLLRFLFRLIPGPHTAFFILASPERIRERKQELPLDTIAALNRRYLALAKKNGNVLVINNNAEPEKAAVEIVEAVITRRAERLGLMRYGGWGSSADASQEEKSSTP
jgi:thymidylate kinase